MHQSPHGHPQIHAFNVEGTMSSSPLLPSSPRGTSTTPIGVDPPTDTATTTLPDSTHQHRTNKQCSYESKRTFSYSNLIWLFGPWVIGVVLGLSLPRRSSQFPASSSLGDISAIMGWTYFSAWSISFYPQLYTNYKRKSVVGLSMDFQFLNLLGFACYAIYNCALYWNPAVRKQYASLHDGQMPAVHSNDVFFSLHAFAATILTLFQCLVYERNGARPHRLSIISTVTTSIVAAIWAIAIIVYPQVDPDPCSRNHCDLKGLLTWLTWLYFLSLVKLVITLIKYIPQIVLNCRRKSTLGWNVWNVVLDFEGGVLSIGQQVLDATSCDRWSPITGNPVKFALGSSSMLFDIIFMVQHFLLYPGTARRYAEAVMRRDIEEGVVSFTPHSHPQEGVAEGEEGLDGNEDDRTRLLGGGRREISSHK